MLSTPLLALSLAVPAAPRAFDEGPPEPALATRLDRIETAFRSGDAASLRLSLASSTKVHVDLPDLPDGPGSYGAGQLQVMFGHIFGAFGTREFSIHRDGVRVSRPGTAFARGRWVRRSQPDGPETVQVLTFTLREEKGDWRISEIRSSR
ncbi:MAG: hypothetical protein HY317_02955 [Acidobacteria bacterium]|nr:hypothetical protein [Acidobacteriota bacterium]